MSVTNTLAEAVSSVPPAHAAGGAADLVSVSGPMMLLTWLAFIVLSVLLYKIAWKPILKALTDRENSIRKALDDADQARAALSAVETETRRMLSEAELRRKTVLNETQTAAARLMAEAEQRAREQTEAALAANRRDIDAALAQARAGLRAETADIVVDLASRLLAERLDGPADRALIEKLLHKLPPA